MESAQEKPLTAGSAAPHARARWKASPAQRFLLAFAALTLLALMPVFILNLLIDPLWYFSGNRLSLESEPFNTRTSKLILVREGAAKYDCAIFGPSVTTLLDQTKINGFSCFNAAFADARVEELPVYARYLKQKGLRARLVIVDLTPRNFSVTRPRLRKLPEFAETGGEPNAALRAYASFDTFWFSLRSAFGARDFPQFYDRNFVSHLRPTKRQPQSKIREEFGSYRDFATDSFAHYQELLAVWPDAEKIGIVSFVGAEAIDVWQDQGILESYIKVSHTASRMFDSYYDFTAPSRVSVNPKTNFDGLHFGEHPNALMAARINGESDEFGIAAHGRSYEAFRSDYLDAVKTWATRLPSEGTMTLP